MAVSSSSPPTLGLPPGGAPAGGEHHAALDGLRALSIVLVLAAHLLPLGPSRWALNTSVGVVGMALFFILSGFLVTTQLMQGMAVRHFLVRRVARILPLAWLYMAIALGLEHAPWPVWWHQMGFVANLPPEQPFTATTAHLWSLCVEMQFYVLSSLTVAALGRRGLLVLPLLAVAITLWRMRQGVYAESYTWLRADEILAGATLALLWHGAGRQRTRQWLGAVPVVPAGLLFLASCLYGLPGLPYLRPYLALLFVGACLAQPASRWSQWLGGPRLAYLATISYALYVWHPLLSHESWLGSGDTLERYLKRPLLLAALFALAHASTFHYERHWIEWARRATRRPPAGLGASASRSASRGDLPTRGAAQRPE